MTFEAWKAQYKARMDGLRQLVYATLAAGGTVYERKERKPWRAGTDWNCTCRGEVAHADCPAAGAQHSFMQPWRTPEYLTDHLMNRHEGFGWDLTIDDVTYRGGKPVVQ